MKAVYVAGAMNGSNILEVLENIERGISLGGEVAKYGMAPFVPHFDVAFALRGIQLPMQFYYDYTMEFLTRCDCVVVCSKSENSTGTKNEIAKAKELGIPVYYSMWELRQGVTNNEF